MQVPLQISRPGWRWGYDAEKVHNTLYTRFGCIRCGCVRFCWQSKREDVCMSIRSFVFIYMRIGNRYVFGQYIIIVRYINSTENG